MVAKQRKLGLAILAACSLTVVACAPMQTGPQKDKTYQITLLHTNDHHGRFWPNKYGEYGLAARKSLVDEIRQEVKAEGGHVLLLSGGDINTGVPESDLQDAEPDFKGMNMVGYDAMAIGNHEFDNPLDILRMQEQWANFPFLAANIYDSNGKRLFEPYKIFNIDGLRIGVMGLTTEDTKKLGNPEFIDAVQFTKPTDEAAQVLPELKKKADIVIAATHMGHYVDANYGINAPGDVTLARTVPGIDVIVGGHSQDPVCMTGENQANESYQPGDPCMPDVQNGTLIMQAHEWGKYVGRADLEYRNGQLKLVKYQLIPVNLKKKVKNAQGEDERVFVSEEIKPDQKVLAFLQPYQDKGQEQLNQVVGNVDKRLEGDRNVVRFKPTNLGHLIAAAQMEKVKADLAVMNSGGVRDSIDAGPITYKEVLMVQPFANMVSSVDLSGKELLDYLRVVAEKPVDSGAFAQFAGVRLEVVGGKLKSAKVNGKSINPKQTYRMAINSYIASGGDGYPKIDTHPGYVNSGFVDAEVLMTYLKKHSPVKAADHEKAEVIRK
ncbi:5'-nucleotidase/2',3'-cyclic phosphodiesterase and related esterases [Hahella chejuensis KCTC 2396]|uniref:5'-nucleotidase/2',3'-cyclic phosphodiesterase and related esterases n=1 Tax=Hahella chejuensis (strain KCTC 2396) TaxID=349521 RepID=Q2SJN6_HAHCH|nr:bifunctional UDP-sugar hydrolase/5'-nucleotidase UshA [Hahella chejuensis]ABC29138.1 5'-nucleotidase/2',3'-cyclic phosphodiesterase and related esterases [Hahella chejuensis KCTC 2396]